MYRLRSWNLPVKQRPNELRHMSCGIVVCRWCSLVLLRRRVLLIYRVHDERGVHGVPNWTISAEHRADELSNVLRHVHDRRDRINDLHAHRFAISDGIGFLVAKRNRCAAAERW